MNVICAGYVSTCQAGLSCRWFCKLSGGVGLMQDSKAVFTMEQQLNKYCTVYNTSRIAFKKKKLLTSVHVSGIQLKSLQELLLVYSQNWNNTLHIPCKHSRTLTRAIPASPVGPDGVTAVSYPRPTPHSLPDRTAHTCEDTHTHTHNVYSAP